MIIGRRDRDSERQKFLSVFATHEIRGPKREGYTWDIASLRDDKLLGV